MNALEAVSLDTVSADAHVTIRPPWDILKIVLHDKLILFRFRVFPKFENCGTRVMDAKFLIFGRATTSFKTFLALDGSRKKKLKQHGRCRNSGALNELVEFGDVIILHFFERACKHKLFKHALRASSVQLMKAQKADARRDKQLQILCIS